MLRLPLLSPLDKEKLNKKEISNFRLVDISSSFSKINELAITKRIVVGRKKFLSPLVSASRNGYFTQHVITKLEKLDKSFTIGSFDRSAKGV